MPKKSKEFLWMDATTSYKIAHTYMCVKRIKELQFAEANDITPSRLPLSFIIAETCNSRNVVDRRNMFCTAGTK